MEIRIFEEPEEAKSEPVRLRLVPYGKNSVMLMAVGPDGTAKSSGNLLRLNSDGTLHRCTSINPDLGFALDIDGKIIACDKRQVAYGWQG